MTRRVRLAVQTKGRIFKNTKLKRKEVLKGGFYARYIYTARGHLTRGSEVMCLASCLVTIRDITHTVRAYIESIVGDIEA